ncbi:flagellar assembly protein FliW [Virgibacillus kekensis]|uniref:Flagellar assembly factor FliW n=1 Tax=Virgibacillus kekensis TaxID=202261 RepID=A0ABV9DGM5_9BACI
MNIKTKYLGEKEIEESSIIHFPFGLPGFPEEKQFALLDMPGNPVFQILQSINSQGTAFIVTNPYLFYRDYAFDLDDNLLETLQIKDEKEVRVLTIVTVKDPFDTSTLNLKAPLILNSRRNLGKQYILNTDIYPSKAAIALSSAGKGE